MFKQTQMELIQIFASCPIGVPSLTHIHPTPLLHMPLFFLECGPQESEKTWFIEKET